MIFDPVNSQIFTLGRYLDSPARTNHNITVSIEHRKKNIAAPESIYIFPILTVYRVTSTSTTLRQIRGY